LDPWRRVSKLNEPTFSAKSPLSVSTSRIRITEEKFVMAKDKEAQGEEQPAAPQQQQSMPQGQIQVNDADAIALYANFCRVTGSPEELIVDFGLNPQPIGIPRDPILIKQRIILNYFTAKRLLHALSMSVQRHEQVFGVLETDINKRLKLQQ
jgi:hypothetical protein